MIIVITTGTGPRSYHVGITPEPCIRGYIEKLLILFKITL